MDADDSDATGAADDLACRDFVELATDYLEEALGRRDRARFAAHLAACPHCAAYLEQVRQTVRALGALPPEPVPSGVRDHLLRLFRERHRAPNDR